jgi:hypothetical protein
MKTLTFRYFALIISTIFITTSLSFAGSKRRGPVTITPTNNGGYDITDIIDIPTHVDKFPSVSIPRKIPVTKIFDLVKHATKINPLTQTMELTTTAVSDATGYIIDELTNQISISVESEPEGYVEGEFWSITSGYSGQTGYGQTSKIACSAIGGTIGDSPTKCLYAEGGYGTTSKGNCGGNTTWSFCVAPDLEITTRPATSDEIRDRLLENLPNIPASDPIWPQILGDLQGRPYWSPERMDAFDDFWRNYGQENTTDTTDVSYDTDPATNKRTVSIVDKLTGQGTKIDVSPEDTIDDPTTSGTDTGRTSDPGDTAIAPEPTTTTGTSTGTTTGTSTNPDGTTTTTTTTSTSTTSTEWPEFCSWATKVCTFIDWVMEPAPPIDIPPPEGLYSSIPTELPTLETPTMPTFLPNKSNCETIVLTVTSTSGNSSSQVFPTMSQCLKLKQGQQLVGWFLYVITWFGVVYIILGHRGGKAQ